MAISRKRVHRGRRGAVLIYVTVGMVAMLGFVSLAVDWGHVRVVKTQLQGAVDTAARWAATGAADGTYFTLAQNAASLNSVDNVALVLQSSDVQVGNWSGSAFVSGGTPNNAVQITGRHAKASSTAVNLYFAKVFGLNSIDVTATAIAYATATDPAGLIGLSSITVHDNAFVASYDSSVTTTPTQTSYNSNAAVESNGPITGHNGDVVHGNATLGPSGSVSSISVLGSTKNGATITASTVTAQTVTNPGGVSQTPSLASGQSVTWPGGTYYFTSLTLQDNNTINFSGPAVIYLDGSATIHDQNTITAYNNLPSNLIIYQTSGNSFTAHDNDTITAEIVAPGANVTFHDHATYYGSLLGDQITFHDNTNFYYDEKINPAGGYKIAIVQ